MLENIEDIENIENSLMKSYRLCWKQLEREAIPVQSLELLTVRIDTAFPSKVGTQVMIVWWECGSLDPKSAQGSVIDRTNSSMSVSLSSEIPATQYRIMQEKGKVVSVTHQQYALN